jgi:hypothetical protein
MQWISFIRADGTAVVDYRSQFANGVGHINTIPNRCAVCNKLRNANGYRNDRTTDRYC